MIVLVIGLLCLVGYLTHGLFAYKRLYEFYLEQHHNWSIYYSESVLKQQALFDKAVTEKCYWLAAVELLERQRDCIDKMKTGIGDLKDRNNKSRRKLAILRTRVKRQDKQIAMLKSSISYD